MITSLGRRKAFFITSTATMVLILLWWIAARIPSHNLGQVFLPTPFEVVSNLKSMAFGGGLFTDIRVSCLRILIGVTMSFALAVPVGLLIAIDRRFEAAAEPVTSALRYTPLTAFIPLLMLELGIGEAHKIAVLSLGIFVQVLPAIVEALRSVERNYLDIASSYGFTRSRLIRSILLPRVLPALIDLLRVGFAIGWAYVVLVEFWGSDAGLGHRLWTGQRFNHPREVYACAMTVGILGLMCDSSIRLLRRVLFPWERGRTLGATE